MHIADTALIYPSYLSAHEDVLNVLLQILDEGTLTDGKGRIVSFKNCIFVMTSNVGSKEILDISRGENPTAVQGSNSGMSIEGAVKSELEKKMKPELLNRIDEIVVFKPLEDAILVSIAENILNETVSRASSEQGMTVTLTAEFMTVVAKEGAFSAAQYGARPMRRAAKRFLEDTLSEAIMKEFLNEGDDVIVDVDDERKKVVKLTRVTNGKESMLIPVEDDSSISVDETNAMDAISRPMPPLPDDDGFQ